MAAQASRLYVTSCNADFLASANWFRRNLMPTNLLYRIYDSVLLKELHPSIKIINPRAFVIDDPILQLQLKMISQYAPELQSKIRAIDEHSSHSLQSTKAAVQGVVAAIFKSMQPEDCLLVTGLITAIDSKKDDTERSLLAISIHDRYANLIQLVEKLPEEKKRIFMSELEEMGGNIQVMMEAFSLSGPVAIEDRVKAEWESGLPILEKDRDLMRALASACDIEIPEEIRSDIQAIMGQIQMAFQQKMEAAIGSTQAEGLEQGETNNRSVFAMLPILQDGLERIQRVLDAHPDVMIDAPVAYTSVDQIKECLEFSLASLQMHNMENILN